MATRTGLLLVCTLCVLAAPAAVASASGANAPFHPRVTLGTVSPAPPFAPAASPLQGPAAAAHLRGARHHRHNAGAAPAAAAPAVASSPSLALASPLAPPKLLANFNGVSSLDSAVTNFGQEFEPPDQGLCAGNGFVLEMVNSAYTVYDTSGKALAGPFNVNGPFEEGLLEFTSDPRCYYDAADHTWFATVLALNKEFTASTLDLAVNPSGDPRKPWTVYKLNTTGLGKASGPKEPGCPCFGDQPTLGFDGDNVYVTTNEFPIVGEEVADGAQIYAFAKKDLVALSPTVHFAHFSKLKLGGAVAESVQPALTTGAPVAEYFLSSIDPTFTFDQRIGVWALTNRAAVAKGEAPTLSSLVLTSESFGVPPGAEQKGTESLLETGDDRMQQVQYIGGSIWGELTTALTIPGDPVQRAGAAWFQVKATVSGGTLAGAHIQHQGYVAVPGNYVIYPAIQATPSGSAAMVMTLSGRTRHPSAAYSVMAPEAGSFGPVTVGSPGEGVYDPTAERWGDYSYAYLDPSGSSVWLATEYVPPKASQTPDGLHNWGTRVFDLVP
jgi:hypothetical protein